MEPNSSRGGARNSARGACDVLVRGAGPAGSTLATLLARAGCDVVLVHRQGPGSGVEEETLVPSARPLLARLEILDAVERAAWHGTPRRGFAWGSDELVVHESRAPERGFQVVRAELDSALRERARAAGARIVSPEDPRVARTGARVTVDATGRPTHDVDAALSPEDALPAMLAFSARVADAGEWRATTFVEAVPEGWLWWLPLRSGGASLTLFADRGAARAVGRDVAWARAIRSARGPARGASANPRRGTSVFPRVGTRSADDLSIGDRASTIDPLSSQGLETALSSAEHAFPCVRALLEGRFDRELVRAYHEDWERRLFRAHRRDTLAYYARETRFPEAPFWRARHAEHRPRAEHARLPCRVRVHAGAEEVRTLASNGASLEIVSAWRRPGAPGALARLGSVAVSVYLEACRPSAAWDDVVARAGRHPDLCQRSRADVEQGLLRLVEEGLLEVDDGEQARLASGIRGP